MSEVYTQFITAIAAGKAANPNLCTQDTDKWVKSVLDRAEALEAAALDRAAKGHKR